MCFPKLVGGRGGHILEASVKAEESLEQVDTRTHILGAKLAPNFFTPKGQLRFILFYFSDILSVSYFARLSWDSKT